MRFADDIFIITAKMRIALKIQYDGTGYFGWQSQSGGNTIQQKIEEAIFDLTQEEVKLHAAGRTDAGVHAFGQVAHFDTNSKIQPDKFCYALNERLPKNIAVLNSIEMPSDFHAQYMSEGKHYRYLILNSRIRQPLYSNRTAQIPLPLDINKMKDGAQYLMGEHDFKSFCSTETCVKSTIRNISELTVKKNDEIIVIDVKGNGFLRNMVRIIAGTLIKCGLGKYPPEHVKEILQLENRKCAGPTSEACGLYLMKVYYPEIYNI